MHYIQVEEAAAHIRDEFQKPAKNYIRKIREIKWSYMCLQPFDKFWMWSALKPETEMM